MSQKDKYTAADFERYHSGKMSAEEMHAIEKAALEDQFLADALEGYANTDTAIKDIEELKQKLFAKKKKKNVFPLISKQNTWLRIAASFVLIAGIGYLAYLLNFNKENNTLAKNVDSAEIKSTTEQEMIPQADSLFLHEKKDMANAITLQKSKETFITKSNTHPTQDFKVSNDEKPSANPIKESLQKSVMPEAQKDISYSRDMNVLKGRLVDSLGKPVVYATIKDKNRNIATTSDSDGRFMLAANDSSLTATISKIGYKTKEKKLDSKVEQVIVIEPDRGDLSEVVVTAYGNKKSKKSIGYATQKVQTSDLTVSDSTLQPLNGWQKFNEYLKSSLIIPINEEGENYRGKVVLSFEINKKGNPKKIKVEQSLCASCNDEATRLLIQGPKWKYVNNKRHVITIEF